MHIFFSVLSLLCSIGAVGTLIYTYVHENKNNDLLIDFHKSLFLRDVAICLFNLALLFELIANMLR